MGEKIDYISIEDIIAGYQRGSNMVAYAFSWNAQAKLRQGTNYPVPFILRAVGHY